MQNMLADTRSLGSFKKSDAKYVCRDKITWQLKTSDYKKYAGRYKITWQ